MGSYSFLSVSARISGPGGSIAIGNTAGSSDEGIKTSFEDDKNTTTTGADGSIMQSLHASQTGEIVVTLLKTSPVNQLLEKMFNFQRNSAANWGQNVIRVHDSVRGDVVTGRQMAFTKFPDNAWAKDGNTLEWRFKGVVNEILGAGAPNLVNP
jgi:hypothetical protein